ncbi:hypothetical protein PIB30_028093 [Stylosanthes scabra]|uniref:Uncharacterized protein n=1 Tax=Stylosanthes scabra TaxID=79078 RepID=A0ABU6TAI7_9FABA|nr:hypothetical protein [Stylosanthes scabra]
MKQVLSSSRANFRKTLSCGEIDMGVGAACGLPFHESKRERKPRACCCCRLSTISAFSPCFAVRSSFLMIMDMPVPKLFIVNAQGSDGIVHGFESARRSILALKTDPLKPRLDHIKKQAVILRLL